ncbi:MAG TPA: BON domain-containing protein, partial [Blastocatellia bacterium]|nr:BON domain-containing protein [Blastocatellia bacterium]
MRKFLTIVAILFVLGGAGYYAYSSNWGPANWVKQKLGLSSDAKTTANVKLSLGLSKRTSPFDIKVQTQEGIVTLTGQVPSEAIKSLAGELASDTAGVAEVRNEILVDQSLQPATESSMVEDLQIKAAILQSLAQSPELGGQKIDVRVDNRIVTLTGSVETPAQRNGAAQTAGAVAGVSAVTNELAVTNPTAAGETPASAPPADANADLAKRVKFELYETGAFETATIDVKAQDGNVTLSGTVRTRAEQALATFVAQGTAGTKEVANNLQISAPPAAPAPRRPA